MNPVSRRNLLAGVSAGAVMTVPNVVQAQQLYGGPSVTSVTSAKQGIVNVEDYRGTGGDFTDQGTLTAAINAFNAAGGGMALRLAAQVYTMTAALPVITGTTGSIRGQGPTTQIIQSSLFTGVGTFFQFGDATHTASYVDVGDMLLKVTLVPTGGSTGVPATSGLGANLNNYCIDFQNATNCSANRLIVSGLGGMCKWGNASGTRAARCTLSQVTGDLNNGMDTDANFSFIAGSAAAIIDIFLTGNVVGGATPGTSAAVVKFAPGTGQLLDTMQFYRFSCYMFDGTAKANGKPYGIYIDMNLGSVTNVTFSDGCVLDHTTTMGCYIRALSTVTGVNPKIYNRYFHLNDTRFVTDDGGGVLLQYYGANNGLATTILRDIHVVNCHINIQSLSATPIATTGASGNGTTVTLTFATQASAIPVGTLIAVAGVAPAGYNGTYVVTASSTTSVSFLSGVTSAYISAGTVQALTNAKAIDIQSSDYATGAATVIGYQQEGNTITDTNNGSKGSAVRIKGIGWSAAGDVFSSSGPVNTSSWAYAYEVSGVDSDYFTLGPSTTVAGPAFVLEPTYTVGSSNRHIFSTSLSSKPSRQVVTTLGNNVIAIPAGAVRLVAELVSGSGGGGSGYRGAAGVVRGGGDGGNGATSMQLEFQSELVAGGNIVVNVGTGGTAGAAVSVDGPGNAGGNGGNTTIQVPQGGTTYAGMVSQGGAGGIQTTNTQAAATTFARTSSAGGTANATGGVGGGGTQAFFPGGGAGGGITTGNVAAAGGVGRDVAGASIAGGAATGANGTNGTSYTAISSLLPGASGSGGGANASGAGGNGGNGFSGGGGGGGGASLTGFNSGAGGTGSNGFATLQWFYQ